MAGPSTKHFNLPLHQHDHYWIGIYGKTGGFSAAVMDVLQKSGLARLDDNSMAVQTPRDWKSKWLQIYAGLEKCNALTEVDVALVPGETLPAGQLERRTPDAIQGLAQSAWLGDALLEGRIMCYLQPVVSAKDKIFGYESFARIKAEDGTLFAGDKIIAASKTLGIEFMIDRHLHVQAIKTFVSSEFNGFLFVNFFPGFIHRPAVYLEGLSETVKTFGIIPKHIVLDFTKSETQRDISHLKSVCDYARSRGYSIALDDIVSVESARKLLPEIRPDFVKIDMQLVHSIADPGKRETIRQLVELVHATGGTVIGEGVESEESYQALRQLGVDLFQGYFFSPPMPVEAALKLSTGT